MQKLLYLSVYLMIALSVSAQRLDSVSAFPAPAAKQAVAVDSKYFYAIDNITIEKYEKLSGKHVQTWKDTTGTFKHLNSGVVLNGKLYCAHSNFPEIPMASSIEVFDTESLTPVESHSFGIDIGSATWIDRHDGFWYVAFAHYHRYKETLGKDNRWTQLVKFNENWERVGAWILPAELIERFGNMSNSGGLITADGDIYLTGHDFKELYLMRFPAAGYALQWVKTLPAPFEGQGIAIDSDDDQTFWGISRSRKEVIRAKLVTEKPDGD